MSQIDEKIALSTCCCSHRYEDGYAMLEWMAGLGFKNVELSHGISLGLVPGIIKAVEDGVVGISSVHNFCPLPMGINAPMPNLFKPSSRHKYESSLWNRYSLETLEFANQIGTDKVVFHSGSVWFFFESPVARMGRWMDQHSINFIDVAKDPGFIEIRDKTIKKIKRSSDKYYKALDANFSSIFDSAKELGVLIGLENREGLAELPLDQDHSSFIKKYYKDSPIRYWHDVGHAEIKVQYGLLNHRERLEDLKDHLIGFHLHDVNEAGKDHQEIGTGIIDFKMVAGFIEPQKNDQALVLELSPSLSEEALLRSRDYVLNLLD